MNAAAASSSSIGPITYVDDPFDEGRRCTPRTHPIRSGSQSRGLQLFDQGARPDGRSSGRRPSLRARHRRPVAWEIHDPHAEAPDGAPMLIRMGVNPAGCEDQPTDRSGLVEPGDRRLVLVPDGGRAVISMSVRGRAPAAAHTVSLLSVAIRPPPQPHLERQQP